MSAGLSDDDIEDRFFLLGRMEILSVLNDLIQRREAVTVSFNGGADYFQSILLEARPEALIFDLGGDERTNRRLPDAEGCVFVARPEGIRVQFSGLRPRRFSWGGTDAFWVSLPERIVRLQRRETFRVLLPVAKPLTATVQHADGTRRGEWPMHDLSVGGLGVTLVPPATIEAGVTVLGLDLLLADHGHLACNAVVRHLTPLGHADGRHRVGVGFSGLSRAGEVAIQRFIIDIEHERRSLAGG